MVAKNSRTVFMCLLCIFLAGAQAQESISASGGDISGNGGSVSYTAGQLFYHTLSSNTGSVSQGVQQPFEIVEMPGVGYLENIDLHSILFPNPVADYVQLQIENTPLDGLSFELYNLQGDLLRKQEIVANLTRISMTSMGSAPYIIRISKNGNEIKAFKIIKK